MEMLKKIAIAGALSLITVGCASRESPASAVTLPTPTPTAVAGYPECLTDVKAISPENVAECALKKDITFAETKELRRIIESDIVPEKYRARLLEPVINAEKLAEAGVLDVYQHKINAITALADMGCSENKPFFAFVALPKIQKGDPVYPEDRSLEVRWHELEHVNKYYKRFLAGDECPFSAPPSEEAEIDYWGRYVEAVARRNGVPSESKELLKSWGIDLPEVVYRVLIPLRVGPDSKFYNLVVNSYLIDRYIINNSPQGPDYFGEVGKAKILQAELDWKETYPKMTLNERLAISQMIRKGLADPKFFPPEK